MIFLIWELSTKLQGNKQKKSGFVKKKMVPLRSMVNTKQECTALLNKGISLRVTSSTLMNEGSSRSHAIFTITIEQKIVKVVD